MAQATAPALVAPRVGLNSIIPISVHLEYGPVHYGTDFGMPMTSDNYTSFNSTPLAIQALQAGQEDVAVGGFASFLAAKESGVDLKVFCVTARMSDNVLVGRNGVTKLEQLFDPNTRV